MEQGSGRHGTELTGGETEPRETWDGAAGNMGRGGGAGSWNLWFL